MAGGATLAGLFSGGEPPDSGLGVGTGVGLGLTVAALSGLVAACAPEEDSDLERPLSGALETVDFEGGDFGEDCVCADLLLDECLLLDFPCRFGVGLASAFPSSINVFAEAFLDHAGDVDTIGFARSAASHEENAAHPSRPMSIKLLITPPLAVQAACGLDEFRLDNFQSGSFRSANVPSRRATPDRATAYRCRERP